MMKVRKNFAIPKWLEILLIVALLAMAVLEANHGEWTWMLIFGGGFLFLAIAIVVEAFSGGTNDNS